MAELRSIPLDFAKKRGVPNPATNATSPQEQGVTLWDSERGCFVVRHDDGRETLLYCEQPIFKEYTAQTDVPNFIGFV